MICFLPLLPSIMHPQNMCKLQAHLVELNSKVYTLLCSITFMKCLNRIIIAFYLCIAMSCFYIKTYNISPIWLCVLEYFIVL